MWQKCFVRGERKNKFGKKKRISFPSVMKKDVSRGTRTTIGGIALPPFLMTRYGSDHEPYLCQPGPCPPVRWPGSCQSVLDWIMLSPPIPADADAGLGRESRRPFSVLCCVCCVLMWNYHKQQQQQQMLGVCFPQVSRCSIASKALAMMA